MIRTLEVCSREGLLTLSIAGALACSNDRPGTSPDETSSGTGTQTTAAVESGSGTSTSAPDTSGDEDPLTPWYGTWYALHPLISVNAPEYWGNGGDALAVTHFELRRDGATIVEESCLWDSFRKFEYELIVAEDGVAMLQPVGGVHEFEPHGEIARLYIHPGLDCGSLTVREVDKEGEELDLFGSAGAPLVRGKLCLEKCAEKQGDWGIITDCGTPVPWPCSE